MQSNWVLDDRSKEIFRLSSGFVFIFSGRDEQLFGVGSKR
jgi:hypothetical protein